MDRLLSMQVFCRVVERQGFAAAARALDLSPSVVTRLVADLEGHLGVRLLNRSTRRLALTEAGERYHEQARAILTQVTDAEASARDTAGALRGHLKVLTSPAFATHELARHLPAFRRQHPALTISLSAPGMVETLDEAHDLSLITAFDEPQTGLFVARQLACSYGVLCASPAYLSARGHPLVPDDLRTHDIMSPSAMSELTLHPRGDPPDASARDSVTLPLQAAPLITRHIDTVRAAAVAGLGLAVLPSYVAADGLRRGELVWLLPAWYVARLVIYAAMPTRRLVPAKTRAFMDFMRSLYGDGTSDPWLAEREAGVVPSAIRRPARTRAG